MFMLGRRHMDRMCDLRRPDYARAQRHRALVDPAVAGSDIENANSVASLKTRVGATGLSVADVMKAHGFPNFTEQAVT